MSKEDRLRRLHQAGTMTSEQRQAQEAGVTEQDIRRIQSILFDAMGVPPDLLVGEELSGFDIKMKYGLIERPKGGKDEQR